MRYVQTIISSLLLLVLIYVLNIPINAGDSTVPPLGSFLSPFSGFWANADSTPKEKIDLEAEGITDNVKIVYDERNVPHIYAENIDDLIFAQGYAIAKERLWQMDITTRAIEGKTAEILGESSLTQDKNARRIGLKRAASLADQSWSENREGYRLVSRFSDGINYFIKSLRPSEYPLEFKLLNYEPQEWSPYRTALFIKAMAVTLNSQQYDLASTNALNTLGREAFDDLYPDRNKKQSPIIEKSKWREASISFERDISKAIEKLFDSDLRSDKEQFIGSNNFAVDASKSATGHAILANDPHLKLTLPSIWIEMHLVCPDFNVYGVSLPGMPGVTLGFNESISWGQTNVGQDVLDLYEVKWLDSARTRYLVDTDTLETEIIIENFDVKGAESVTDTVLYTIWGPIIKENGKFTNLARRWVSTDSPISEEIDVYLDINRSENYEEFKAAINKFQSPAQNFIFSSVNGDIAMIVAGKFPVKTDQQGRFVQDGTTRKSEWKGFIPFDELPQELNPSRHFVASANQHSADEKYPYYYNGGFEDFRGRYINRKLEHMDSVTIEDLMNLQLDAYSLKAEEALPLLLEDLELKTLTKKEKQVVESLQKWNFVYTSNSKAASYFEKWWSAFYEMTFDEIDSMRITMDVPYVEAFRLIEMMEDDHPIFDISETMEVESLSDIVQRSFTTVGFDTLTVLPWSEMRNTTIDHLTNIPAFGYDEINSPGHPNTPNAISRHTGPSWRMVVEMSDPIKAYGIYPGGISGNPGSPYYNHFIQDWNNGQYYELNNSNDASAITAISTLTLKSKR